MEYIQDQNFYHIQKLNSTTPWLLNQTFFFGESKNKFFGFYDTFQYQDPLPNVLSDYIQYAREMIFEEIRQKHFPHLPSRQRCLWLIPIKNDNTQALDYWKTILLQDNTPHQILLLNCSGKIHYANQSFLDLHVGNFNYFREKAFKYWSGLNVDTVSSDIECLFEGFVTVERILSSTIHT
ncbi:DUF2441 domain-containing protein [Phascolarctobacterium faecium]|uniref:DUF2441 domain-containing protein n=1 Tax=Phascolarctobacterium faecium TaxID=33025 RepID=UPI00307AD0C3